MSETETAKTLRSLLAAYVDVPPDDSQPLELDSLSMVRLIEELEDAFGISVRAFDATPDNFRSLASIALLVKVRQA